MPSLTARTGTSCKAIKTNLLFFHITKVKIVVQRCLIDVNARTLDTSIQTCSKLFLTLYSPVGHFILLFSTEDLIYKGLKVLGVYKQRIRQTFGRICFYYTFDISRSFPLFSRPRVTFIAHSFLNNTQSGNQILNLIGSSSKRIIHSWRDYKGKSGRLVYCGFKTCIK